MGIPVNDGLLQVFDVEHGSCALLTSPAANGWRRLMIDCGHSATTGWHPGDHLRRLGATRLDELIVTNYDEDHVSGFNSFSQNKISLDWLTRNVSVGASTIRSLKSEDGMGPGIDSLVRALQNYGPSDVKRPSYFGVSMELFRNEYPSFDDENNLSLVVYLSIHGRRFLFPGDMECQGFEALLAKSERFRRIVGSLHVLVASHHGRETGICPEMFDTWGCSPQLVVISDDCKQFSTQETVNYYANQATGISGFRVPGIRKVLTTRSDGEICFSFANGNCIVS